MMDAQRTKEMGGDEANVKTKADDKKKPTRLRCVRESEMPGVGLFKAGDIIEEAQLIESIGDNPNFENISEGEKS